MAALAWINKILYKANKNAQANEYILGTTFDNVRSTEDNGYTLATLVQSLKSFFEKQSFMHYSKQTPPNNSRYMEWYCLEGNEGEFDTETNWTPNESLA